MVYQLDTFDSGDGSFFICYKPPNDRWYSIKHVSNSSRLNETSLEQSLIDIAAMTDERGLKIAARGVKMIVPSELQFTAERLDEVSR